LIPAKKEKAEARVKSFRKELSESRSHFEALKGERQEAAHTVARSELLGRRGHSSATPENPYANVAARANPFAPSGGGGNVALAVEDHAFRERDFFSRTDIQLDEYLDRGRVVLADLAEQRGMLKNTQKRLYSVANTLGISGDTIRMIERRAKQDKWFFYGGVVIFFGFCYLVLRWLR
jgi:Golgi SNAP receptor complex protein 2